MYIRLNDNKVLEWLKGKMEAVGAHLVAKMGDATVATFNDASFEHEAQKESLPKVLTDGDREFSAGVVSEYISPSWTGRLCEAAGLRNILETSAQPRVAQTPNMREDLLLPQEETAQKRKAPVLSLGARKLAKVSSRELKGMKPMASFFKPKPKA
eukprot:TRINITY_DN29730_c0_g1_i2.p1 TRINITY_DN29730_c0_g1~~TRINITY_DN29730_c0_g1_i2.p1  ORF type:complete len:155 (+),score=19.44 TRINITY_DN29730_c0_g1_i2:164-628(+)